MLELIPRLVDIVIPRILLLTIKITTPTIINATKVVSENRILNTTNYIMKGYAEKLIVKIFEVEESSFYFSLEGVLDLKSLIFLKVSSSFTDVDFFFCE